jgi:hypothetical protein
MPISLYAALSFSTRSAISLALLFFESVSVAEVIYFLNQLAVAAPVIPGLEIGQNGIESFALGNARKAAETP